VHGAGRCPSESGIKITGDLHLFALATGGLQRISKYQWLCNQIQQYWLSMELAVMQLESSWVSSFAGLNCFLDSTC